MRLGLTRLGVGEVMTWLASTGLPRGDAESVDAAVVELEGVEISDGDDVLAPGVVALDEVGEELGLSFALEANGLAGVGGVVDVDERALM